MFIFPISIGPIVRDAQSNIFLIIQCHLCLNSVLVYFCLGCILVDDHDIKDFQLRSLREHIILVPQDVVSTDNGCISFSYSL